MRPHKLWMLIRLASHDSLGAEEFTWVQMMSANSLRFWTIAQMSKSLTGSMVNVTRPEERL